jgi:hypothetical protein
MKVSFKKLRILGNVLLMIGQFILLFRDREAGLSVILLGSVLSSPYFVKHRQWDVVMVIALSMCLNGLGLMINPTEVR